jgi:hypothetical protein
MLFICLATLLSLPGLSQTPKHLEIALSYVGVTEVKPNSSPEIDKWLKYVGLNPGYAYCAAYASFCIGTANVREPKIRTARAQSFITTKSIPAAKVLRGQVEIPEGTIVVWKNGNTVFGHVGFTINEWKGATGETVEANTSGNYTGNQREGEGVYIKKRRIVPTEVFRITHFTLVHY